MAQDDAFHAVDIKEELYVKAAPQREGRVAVALSMDDDAAVPHITASGRDELAEAIVELAQASGVKIREDADLAEMLAALEIDSPIPIQAYLALAEILSYVYQANASASQRKERDNDAASQEIT